MTEFVYPDIAPVFEGLGAAMFEAQHLESGLALLLSLMNEKAGAGTRFLAAPLDVPDAPKTIGQLFKEVRLRKYLIEAEKRLIQDGVRERNGLVHAYWTANRVLALGTPAGRDWIVKDLDRIREVCRKAGRKVDAIIDMYLKEAGTSLHELSNPLWEAWEAGNEPPPEVLH